MKRVMHVIAGLGTGGTEVMCLRLARHWQGRFDQHILAWETSSRSLERDFQQLSQTSVSVIPPDKQTHLQRWRWVRAKVAQVKPDAVLIHCFGIPHIISAVAARSVGVNSISAWAGNPPSRTLISRLRFTAVLMASRVVQCPVVSCSSAVAQEFGKLGIGMPARSAIVPNAIDVAYILSTARKSHGSRCDLTPTIAMVSRLDIIKDHATLLDAFAKIHRDIPNARLWVIGDGSLRTSLEERAHNLGISRSTTFFGNRTDVANLLGQTDVFAFSTTQDEGFGIVLIEAMAAGIPIVATDVAACREVLANGEAGLLVAPSDADALALALRNVLNTPELRARMSSNSLRRVRAEYGIERCAERWEAQLFGTQEPIDRLVECES